MQFPTIAFKGDWKEHLGLPEKGFLMLIYGKPGSGKSTYAIKFADYLSRNHGKTLYVSAEELIGYTLQDKIKRSGAIKAKFVGELPNNLSGWDFIFLDSAQKLGLKLSDIEKTQQKISCNCLHFHLSKHKIRRSSWLSARQTRSGHRHQRSRRHSHH